MNINLKECTEEELWKYVAVHLKNHNIDTILVGGTVVSIHSEGAYESGDLDFVLTDLFVKNLPEIMKKNWFSLKERSSLYSSRVQTSLFHEFVKVLKKKDSLLP